MVCRKVTLVQQGVEAETHEQSARFIREHWESVWSEGRLANPALSRQLASDFGFRPAGHWVGPSASDLHRALLHCKGSAGPDQWHSAEVKHLPFDAVQVWWTLTQRWLRSGSVPMQLTESRMVNLAKEGKVSGDGSLDPAATRPISVLSVFWRAFAAALLQTEDVQDWVSQSLDERVACRKAGLTTEALIARLQALYADQDGYIVSLDWSAAYDRLSPVICCQALTDCGWDPRFATLLQAVWANQVRWVQWGAHTSPTPLPSGRAVPQGCPIAPTILGFVATAGLRKVESNLGHDAERSCTSIYMDDRTWWAKDWHEVGPRVQEWARWSDSIGLKENNRKTQVCARRSFDNDPCPPEWKVSEVKALGVSTTSKVRKYTIGEQERLDKAEKAASLLVGASLPWTRAVEAFRCFVLSIGAYGWVCRSPTLTSGDRLLKSFRRVVGGKTRMASKWLLMLFFGGSLHLVSAVIQRLWGTLSKLDLPWCNSYASPVGVLRRQLKGIGCSEVRPWTWRCYSGVEVQLFRSSDRRTQGLSAQRHELRMQFRWHAFVQWLRCQRHEVTQLLQDHSKENLEQFFRCVDIGFTRKRMDTDSTFRHVALGASVSPALYDPALQDCPFCQGRLRPSWIHLVWHCEHFRDCRPSKPRNPLTARFGWASGPADSAVMDHLTKVQEAVWRLRHGEER
ncbi:unnamed protein product [Durusdinium trenchii]|uniref:Reverse transcriptase domain-containing protein n=1 Tax=Durusdinium trenchii TaxID=1381693 RepID=A0ABP0MBC2_9DINO